MNRNVQIFDPEIKENILFFGIFLHHNDQKTFHSIDMTDDTSIYLKKEITLIDDGLFFSNQRKKIKFYIEDVKLYHPMEGRRIVHFFSNNDVHITKYWVRVYNILAKSMFLSLIVYHLLNPFINLFSEYVYFRDLYDFMIKDTDLEKEIENRDKVNFGSFLINKISFGYCYPKVGLFIKGLRKIVSIENIGRVFPEYSQCTIYKETNERRIAVFFKYIYIFG